MGLTFASTKKSAFSDLFNIDIAENQYLIALAGNPNTGKSTVFNYLTGLNQHTGNWPGKTVVNARGKFKHQNEEYILIDVPGTYSLFATSEEEVVARDFICFGNPDAVIVVCDATCMERNLNLVFQIMELTDNLILVVNLMDEAKKKNITINKLGIEMELGIPVILTSAKTGQGMEELKAMISKVVNKEYEYQKKEIVYNANIEERIKYIIEKLKGKLKQTNLRWWALRILDGDHKFFSSMKRFLTREEFEIIDEIRNELFNINQESLREQINETSFQAAENLKTKHIKEGKDKFARDKKIDNIVTSKIFGIPLMLLLLLGVFFITIKGANYPSQLLAEVLFGFEKVLTKLFIFINAPDWLHGLLVLGLYRTLAWVVSVMLPPMAIFFPLFTLLEDLGYLPRVAYNLDHLFKKACAHGKQCLSMCMGFGCNAAGIIGTRIIESPQEKMIAILTNNFVPCNGRFPTLIAISTVFFAYISYGKYNSFTPALIVTGLIILGVIMTLVVSFLLSKTILKGIPSAFTLELPPYRKPKIGRVIYTSILDRTIFVLSRAAIVAIPAGIIIWTISNIYINGESLLQLCAKYLTPFANLLSFDGIILLAFILSLPANEILLPIILMAYLSTGNMVEYESIDSLRTILINNGWTYHTAINLLLFSLFHWPCSTTLLTIKKETGSWKWTFAGFIIPSLIGIIVCMVTTFIYHLF
ncbi:MAG TPA: ferrous iron transport protein B [Acholeplasmataceae bacterium]|nr:ferrous iron transport protein B [Acholeplasmataceae bacterium]